jgi:hypothetical protein
MSEIKPPAPNPCGSCPYRRDVPSGVWSAEEYAKLETFDGATGEQPTSVFLCHQQDGRACAGWVGCHDMRESLGLRLAMSRGMIEDPGPFIDYETTVPLFDSGAEAGAHGMSGVLEPDGDAQRLIDKLISRHDKRKD